MTNEPETAPSVETLANQIRERNPSLTDRDDPIVRRLAFLYRALAVAEAQAEQGNDNQWKAVADFQKLSNDALRLERALGLLKPSVSRPTGAAPSARHGSN